MVMKYSMRVFKNGFTLIVFLIGTFFAGGVPTAHAATGNNATGYAWSSNIGWVSMNNCTDPADATTCSGPDYGVTIPTTAPGTITGTMWSSNIGWISFDSAAVDTPDCPPDAGGSCKPAYADWAHPNSDGSVNILGWARACSVFKTGCSGSVKDPLTTGGWDGYISFNDTKTTDSVSWAVKLLPSGTMTGSAWGAEVVGWLDFTGVTYNKSLPTSSLTANPTVVAANGNTMLTITASDIKDQNACTGNFGTIVMKNTSGSNWSGTRIVTVPADTTYNVTCTGSSTGSTSSNADVKVMKANLSSYACASYPPATKAKLTWNVANAKSCVLQKQGSSTNETVDPSSTVAIGGMAYYEAQGTVDKNPTTFTLTCTTAGSGGQTDTASADVAQCSTPQADFSVSVTPNPGPLVAGTDPDTKVATFTVAVNEVNGFNDSVNLAVDASNANLPAGSLVSTISPSGVSYTGSGYPKATFTVSIPASSVPVNWTSGPIKVTGTSTGGIFHSQNVMVTSSTKKKPIFIEF